MERSISYTMKEEIEQGMQSPPLTKLSVNGIEIAYLFRRGGRNAIVFIHGLGDSKEKFQDAFMRRDFKSFTMLSTDLVGFGDSEKPHDFSYLMQDQALLLKIAIEKLKINEFHLVAQSIGGIIGIELSELLPERVLSFTSAEGNLTPEDSFITRKIAGMGEKEFSKTGFKEFKESWIGLKATPTSVYRTSVSALRESEEGNLLDRFMQIRCHKAYLIGERDKGVFPVERLLRERGIPVTYVSGSGHFMVDENPDGFWNQVLKSIRESE